MIQNGLEEKIQNRTAGKGFSILLDTKRQSKLRYYGDFIVSSQGKSYNFSTGAFSRSDIQKGTRWDISIKLSL